MKTIYFRFTNAPYGALSNFYPVGHPNEHGDWCLSGEHDYQSHKFPRGSEPWGLILAAKSPYAAALLGRNPKYKALIHPDWDRGLKDRVMGEVLQRKSDHNEWVRGLLLSTGEAYLVERSDKDPYWGDGYYRDGINQLGKLWMARRQALQAAKVKVPFVVLERSGPKHPKYHMTKQGLAVGYHWEGGETFEESKTKTPLSLEGLQPQAGLFLSHDPEAWAPTHLDLNQHRLYEVQFTVPAKEAVCFAWNAYQHFTGTTSLEDTRRFLEPPLHDVGLLSMYENDRFELPESLLLNAQQHVQSIRLLSPYEHEQVAQVLTHRRGVTQ